MYVIEHLYEFLNIELLFCSCALYSETKEQEKYLSSLLIINKNNINYNNLNDLILNKKLTTFSLCEN